MVWKESSFLLIQSGQTANYGSCYKIYRIYSINRPGRLLNFWTLREGVYSRWALIRGWAIRVIGADSPLVQSSNLVLNVQ